MSWVRSEMAQVDLGDERLNARAMCLLERFISQPTHSIPTACRGWSETQAAYRFFDNAKVSPAKVLAPHQAATLERMKAHERVLCLEDTSEVDFSDPTQSRGLGPLSHENQRGLHLHVNLALTPDRLCLGHLDALMWARRDEDFHKRRQRAQKPLQDKESRRWWDGYRQVCRLSQELPHTRLTYIADREGDLYDIFVEAEMQNHCADYVIRAHHDRMLQDNQKISEALVRAPCLGQVQFDLPHSHARTNKRVEQTLKAVRVTVRRPELSEASLEQVEVTVVLAQETHPPKGEAPITWILLTNCNVQTQEQAMQIVQWYLCRWQIEVFFRILKSGCKIEELQLETSERLQSALALYMIVAWRVLYLTMLGRDCPNTSCEAVFEEAEWQAVYIVARREPPPQQPPTLNTMIRMIAGFGGFLGRKHDGEPGPQSIWIGLQRTRDFVLAVEATKVMMNS